MMPIRIRSAVPSQCGVTPGHVELTAGFLSLDEVGGFALVLAFYNICTPGEGPPQSHEVPFTMVGSFRLVGEKLELFIEADTPVHEPTYTASFQATDIIMTHQDVGLRFRLTTS